MTQNLTTHLYRWPYVIVVSALTLFFWLFELDGFGIGFFLFIAIVLFMTLRDTAPTLPLLINAMFMISHSNWVLDDIPLYLYVIPVVLLLTMSIRLIRFRPVKWKGKMTFSLLWMILAFFLSVLTMANLNITYLFLSLVGVVYLAIYLFYVNTIESRSFEYFFKILFMIGVLVMIQTFVYYIRADDAIVAIRRKSLDAGWGISNQMGLYLLVGLSVTTYYATKLKHNIHFIFIGGFQVAALLLTLARGSIGTFAFIGIPLLIYAVPRVKKRYTLLYGLLTIAVLVVLALWQRELTDELIRSLSNMGLSDRGRWSLYREAWDVFRANPLFGEGFFTNYIEEQNIFWMYHNTFLHTLATMGLFGFGALLVQLYMTFKIVFSRRSQKAFIVLLILIGTNIVGLVDNTYYNVHYMIILLTLLAVIEQDNALFIDPIAPIVEAKEI